MARFGKSAETLTMVLLGVIGVVSIGAPRIDGKNTADLPVATAVNDATQPVASDGGAPVDPVDKMISSDIAEIAAPEAENETPPSGAGEATEGGAADDSSASDPEPADARQEATPDDNSEQVAENDVEVAVATAEQEENSADAPVSESLNEQELAAPGAPNAGGDALQAAPEIDLSRFDGDTAILAGTGTPGSEIIVTDQTGEIARGTVDGTGNFALSFDYQPPSEGSVLQIAGKDSAGAASAPNVITVLPDIGGAQPTIAEITDGEVNVTRVAPSEALALGEVSYGQAAPTQLSGFAPAGALVEIVIDGIKRASVTADDEGRWQFETDQLAAGAHILELRGADGTVSTSTISIAENHVPADAGNVDANTFPTDPNGTATEPVGTDDQGGTVAVADASDNDGGAAAPAASLPTPPVTAEYVVKRGDSLWRIARNRYGEGIRFTDIYDLNAGQINDPDLIFPGQVFEVK